MDARRVLLVGDRLVSGVTLLVKMSIRGVEEINAFIKTVPRGTVKIGLRAIATYIIGTAQHGLRHDEPQKYVSRKKAGYKTSAKQWAYLFASGILESDRRGNVTVNHYKRTGETAAAWKAVETKGGYGQSLQNPKIGAHYTRDDQGQTRQHALAGRRKVSAVIAANLAGALRSAQARVNEWLRKG